MDKAIHGLCPRGRPQETPTVSWVDGQRILLGQTCSTVCYGPCFTHNIGIVPIFALRAWEAVFADLEVYATGW